MSFVGPRRWRAERERERDSREREREARMREEGKKKKKTAQRERDESERRKKKRGGCRVFFLIYAYAGQCGAGRISAGEKCVYPQPAPPRTGWIKYNPNPSKNTLNPGGSVRFCGLGGFLPSPNCAH
jgi:hypothetical protein